MRDRIIEALREAMNEVVEIDTESIGEDDALADLGVDSLDFIEIVMVVEEKLEIETKSDDFEGVATVGDAVRAIEAHLATA